MLFILVLFKYILFVKSISEGTNTIYRSLPSRFNEKKGDTGSSKILPLKDGQNVSDSIVEPIPGTEFILLSSRTTLFIINTENNDYYLLANNLKKIMSFCIVRGTDYVILAGEFEDDQPKASGSLRLYNWKLRSAITNLYLINDTYQEVKFISEFNKILLCKKFIKKDQESKRSNKLYASKCSLIL